MKRNQLLTALLALAIVAPTLTVVGMDSRRLPSVVSGGSSAGFVAASAEDLGKLEVALKLPEDRLNYAAIHAHLRDYVAPESGTANERNAMQEYADATLHPVFLYNAVRWGLDKRFNPSPEGVLVSNTLRRALMLLVVTAQSQCFCETVLGDTLQSSLLYTTLKRKIISWIDPQQGNIAEKDTFTAVLKEAEYAFRNRTAEGYTTPVWVLDEAWTLNHMRPAGINFNPLNPYKVAACGKDSNPEMLAEVREAVARVLIDDLGKTYKTWTDFLASGERDEYALLSPAKAE